MATADTPRGYETDDSMRDPVPGLIPWRDDKGVWHFGGSGSTGSGRGVTPPTGGSKPPTTPPATVPPGGSTTPPGVPGGVNWGDFLTTLSGGLLSGLGQIFGQQRRQSYSGTAADPVQALSGVQRRISDMGDTLQSRATSPVSLSAPDVSAVRRAVDLPNPAGGDLDHLRASLRAMGVDI